jgi:hypothetical protein
VFEYNWVRIFVFSGMKSFDITKRYLEIIRKEIIEPACCELRHDLKPPIDEVKLSERELEMFWGPARSHLPGHPALRLSNADASAAGRRCR